MDYYDIERKVSKGTRLENINLRVVSYSRVSTDKKEQINSLNNQINYYKNYIQSKDKWIYINSYIDEGVTGVRVEKRKEFLKMIEDAKNNKFDLIITKEVSRFARDLEDSIHYIRLLKKYNVGVYFENQNLNTFDLNSSLVLNIMFNLAQEESTKLSNRIKFGHKEAIKKGHVLGSRITGYQKDNCKLVVDEKEAKLIKRIFELYSTNKYGLNKLSQILAQEGYYNHNENLYDKDTLKRIITNPKYKGYYRAGEYEVLDYRTKTRKKNKQEDQIIYKCDSKIIPSIVTEKIWNKANLILKERTIKYNNSNNYSGGLKYPYSSKIFCEDNKLYQRINNKKNPSWACSNYIKYGINKCQSPIIPEKDLNIIFIRFLKNNLNIRKIKETMINDYKNIINDKIIIKIKRELENKLIKLKEQKKKTINLYYKNIITEQEIIKECTELNKNILKEQEKIIKFNAENINKYLLDKISNNINIDERIIFNLLYEILYKICVTKINDSRKNLKLNIYLNLKENICFNNMKYQNKINYLYFIQNKKD